MREKNYRPRRKLAGIYLVDVILALIIFAMGVALGFLMGRYPEDKPAPVQAVEPVVEQAEQRPTAAKVKAVAEIATTTPEPAEPEEPEPVSLGEFKITHYCPCEKCCGEWADGITATGTKATQGRTIAVDPDVIPYGTKVLLRYADGTEHAYIAEDCGGAIQNNRIDVFTDSHQAALVEGVKTAEVFIVEE